jgi:hypothetical protein
LASSLFCLSVTAQDVLNVKNDKVGVRTDDPQVPLHVVLSGTPFALHPVTTMAFQNNANTTDAVVFSLIGGTAANAQINFANSGDEFAGRIIYSFGIQAMRFFNGPTEKMRITSSGDVGIGTTTPAGKLDVNGAIYQRGGVVHPDFVFEPAYQLETIEEHEAYMWENKHLPAVGKGRYDEQGRSIIEVGKQSASILEELEKAHLYIAQLNTELKNERLEKERSMAELDERLARLEALLAAQNTVQ